MRVVKVWISKKKWEALEKRVADLEGQIQSQPQEIQQKECVINELVPGMLDALKTGQPRKSSARHRKEVK